MMNKEQTISCPSPKIIAHNSNDEKVSTLQDSQYSIFADQRPTSYQPSTIIMVFVVVCGMLPLVFALSSTKLSIFTLVDLVLLATCSYFLLSHLEDIKSTNLREVNTEVRSWLRALRVRYGT